MDGGWTKSYRRLWTHPVFRNFRDAAVWSYLIDNAAWRDCTDVWFRGRRIMLSEGQIVSSERELAEGFCCDRQVIRRILDALEKNQMINREKTQDYTIITVCNYKAYQSSEEEEKPTVLPEETQGKPTENPPYIDKNSKNLKNLTDADDAGEQPDWIILGYKVMDMMGVRDSPNWFGNASPAKAWISWGADWELDVKPTVDVMLRRHLAKGRGPPRTLNFFDAGISDAIANRQRPRPEAANVHRLDAAKQKPTQESDRRIILETLGLGTGFGGMEHDPDDPGAVLEGEYRCSH